MEQRRAESEWLSLVSAWRRSGSSVSRFAREHGVAVNSLAYWVNREKKRTRLVKVEVVEAPVASASVELLVRGAVMRVSTSVSPAWVAELLRHVGED